ncbi:EamA family transporter, partial [Klebsiella pneumoniae]
ASGALLGLAALLFESREVQWSTPFVLTLGWLVLGLSFGAVGLLYTLIRHGAASKVASLFYLVPAVTAIMDFMVFGNRLGWL